MGSLKTLTKKSLRSNFTLTLIGTPKRRNIELFRPRYEFQYWEFKVD